MPHVAPPAGPFASRRHGVGRTLVIAATAFAGLGLTAGLLWGLSPRPLVPDAVRSLPSLSQVSVAAPSTDRAAPDPATVARLSAAIYGGLTVEQAAWSGIELIVTGTADGNAAQLADAARGRLGPAVHFVICNGSGGDDGEIQVTSLWDRQHLAPGAGPDRVRVAVVAPDADALTPRQAAAARALAASVVARSSGAG